MPKAWHLNINKPMCAWEAEVTGVATCALTSCNMHCTSYRFDCRVARFGCVASTLVMASPTKLDTSSMVPRASNTASSLLLLSPVNKLDVPLREGGRERRGKGEKGRVRKGEGERKGEKERGESEGERRKGEGERRGRKGGEGTMLELLFPSNTFQCLFLLNTSLTHSLNHSLTH